MGFRKDSEAAGELGLADNYLDKLARMIREEVPSQALPQTADADTLFRIYAVLVEAMGASVSARDVHNAWVAWMLALDPTHESLVPYGELPSDVAQQDEAYVAAIHRVAAKVAGATQSKLAS